MEEELGDLEVLKEDLGCANSVSNGVVGRLSQQHRVFSRVDLELLEDVSPHGLHVFPVLDHSVFHWVVKFQDALDLLSLLSNESLLFVCSEHDSFVLGTAHTKLAR